MLLVPYIPLILFVALVHVKYLWSIADSYTHSDHLEAPDVLRLAGCEAPTTAESAEIGEAESQQAELERLDKEMAEWKIKREAELERSVHLHLQTPRHLFYPPKTQ